MEFISFVEKWWLRITVLLYALGFLIHNLYLAKFSVYEFDLLQTRYIYTGIAALLYYAAILLFAAIQLDLEKPQDNLGFLDLTVWLYRFPLLCVVATALFFPGEEVIQNFSSGLVGNTLANSLSYSIVILSSLYISFILYRVGGGTIRINPIMTKYVKILYSTLAVILIAFLLYASLSDTRIRDIFWFSANPFFVLGGYLMGVSDRQTKGPSFIQLFQSTNPDNQRKYHRIAYGFLVLIFVTSMSYIYSQKLYPRIPMNLGGAHPIRARLITGQDTLDTRILNENSNWMLVQLTDSSAVIRYSLKDIRQIIIAGTSHDTTVRSK